MRQDAYHSSDQQAPEIKPLILMEGDEYKDKQLNAIVPSDPYKGSESDKNGLALARVPSSVDPNSRRGHCTGQRKIGM